MLSASSTDALTFREETGLDIEPVEMLTTPCESESYKNRRCCQ